MPCPVELSMKNDFKKLISGADSGFLEGGGVICIRVGVTLLIGSHFS